MTVHAIGMGNQIHF